ncbi:unnamed protein product, partial [Ectocarpus sp. 12 AP-2014]
MDPEHREIHGVGHLYHQSGTKHSHQLRMDCARGAGERDNLKGERRLQLRDSGVGGVVETTTLGRPSS